MRKSLVVFVAIAVLAAGGAAWAATTSVTVSATVVGTCQFNNAGSIAFGPLDQVLAPLVTGTVVQPAFWCTKNSVYAIVDDEGSNASGTTHRMKHATLAEYIPYTFTYLASGAGTGKTTPITMDIAATVPAGSYVDVPAGAYADIVTLTITP